MEQSPLHWMLTPLQRCLDFRGRSRRAEFWWFTLFWAVIAGTAAAIDVAVLGADLLTGIFNGRLLLEFVSGAGFTGIAVALMGRNHPVGIILASVLFGALFQGGAEVAFEVRGFSRDMVVMLQGFIVLFSGAMAYVIAPLLARVLAWGGRHG